MSENTLFFLCIGVRNGLQRQYTTDKTSLFTHHIYFPGSLGALDRFRDSAHSQDSSVYREKFPTNTFQRSMIQKPFPEFCMADNRRTSQRNVTLSSEPFSFSRVWALLVQSLSLMALCLSFVPFPQLVPAEFCARITPWE